MPTTQPPAFDVNTFADKVLAEYRTLVQLLADGQQPGEERIREVLTLAGRTPQQLQADIESYQQRKLLAAQLEAAEQQRKDLPKLQAEAEKLRQKLDELEADHQRKKQPLLKEWQAARQRVEEVRRNAALQATKQQLSATAAPEVAEAIERNHYALGKAQRELAGIQREANLNAQRGKQIAELKRSLQEGEAELNRLRKANHPTQSINQQQGKLREMREKLDRLESQYAEDMAERVAAAEAKLARVQAERVELAEREIRPESFPLAGPLA